MRETETKSRSPKWNSQENTKWDCRLLQQLNLLHDRIFMWRNQTTTNQIMCRIFLTLLPLSDNPTAVSSARILQLIRTYSK